jgi:hypothetical protein
MTRRRVIKRVLDNFLGTFTSRYSDFDGYWVFGFLVESMDSMNLDLLNVIAEGIDVTPSAFVRRQATQKFAEQLMKAKFPTSRLQEAHLTITRSPVARFGTVNHYRCCAGYDVRLLASAVTDLEKTYSSTLSIFVAPHDPQAELRSGRAIL